jgi:glycosyltransferase involved in cell wall biosynthesis
VSSPPAADPGIAFISWAEDCSRSDSIAARLGGTSHMVYSPEWGSRPATILFKYASQALKTWRILRRDRPHTVFVMTPPPFAALPVWLYCRLTGGRYFIDAHSAAFYHPRWKNILFIKRFFCRRARATLVTNGVLEAAVRSWNAPVLVVPDVPIRFREPEPYPLPERPAITLVCTFADDEPVHLLFAAARELPEVPFFVTGDPAQADPALLASRPANVTLTGFIPRARYVGLLQGSAAIMTLTTDDNTMQRGAYEAIYLGKPVITVDHSFLRREFASGTVHVPLTAAGIRDGVRRLLADRARYETEAAALRATKLERWERVGSELRRLMA